MKKSKYKLPVRVPIPRPGGPMKDKKKYDRKTYDRKKEEEERLDYLKRWKSVGAQVEPDPPKGG
jgi:hypothetical protein